MWRTSVSPPSSFEGPSELDSLPPESLGAMPLGSAQSYPCGGLFPWCVTGKY